MMNLKQVPEKTPNNITVMYLQVIVMPNGEVINDGETVGWFKNKQKYLYEECED